MGRARDSRWWALTIAGLACSAAVAACGSGGQRSSGPYGAASSPIALSRCMRANGVTNFPDPTAGPGGEGFNGIFISVAGGPLTVDGITFSGPVAQAAEKACAEYLPPGGPPPVPTAAQKQRILAFARCMRANGVPNFPDPTFGVGGPQLGGGQQAIVPSSPAVQHAAAICGKSGQIRIQG